MSFVYDGKISPTPFRASPSLQELFYRQLSEKIDLPIEVIRNKTFEINNRKFKLVAANSRCSVYPFVVEYLGGKKSPYSHYKVSFAILKFFDEDYKKIEEEKGSSTE